MSEFAKGTWDFDTQNGEIIADGYRIAKVYGATIHNYEDNARECWTNAHLITAAPEMYDLLQSLSYRTSGMESHEVLKIRELLARIDGTEAQS